MANVKNRFSPNRTKKGRSAPSSESTSNAIESIAVMKKNMQLMTSKDKSQYSNTGAKGKSNKNPIKKREIKKRGIDIDKNIRLMSKSGRIKKKCKEKLGLFNILKSELLISDTEKKTVSKCKPNTNNKKNSINNNNDIGISDHNQSETILDTDSDNDGVGTSSKVLNSEITKEQNTQTDPDIEEDFIDLTKEQITQTDPEIVVIPENIDEISIYECDYCGKKFTCKKVIERHMHGHLNIKPFKCMHCSKKYRYKINMQVHLMRLHSDDFLEEYKCYICDQVFLFKETLNNHLNEHVRKANFFKCIFCDKKYSESNQLFTHEKTHLIDDRYQCPMCDMNYGIRSHFEAHLKGHSKVKDFMCQYCGKEFLRLNSMHRHVQVCHSGYRIQCPICKKQLKGHLTEHMRTHDKKRPHECLICEQRFTQSTQLNVHMRSHTGARPYPCKICGRLFSHSNALMLHIRRHTGEKPFPCAMCPLTFSQLPHMKAHMRNIHGKENAYMCTKCTEFFKLKVDLEKHMKVCTASENSLSFEGKIQASGQHEEVAVESAMTLSRMRYLLALLLTIIATKDKLKYLGFNKRLIDDLLIESLEAMDLTPCRDGSLSAFQRLKINIEMFLNGTVPKEQMEKLKEDNKTTEEVLELLTSET